MAAKKSNHTPRPDPPSDSQSTNYGETSEDSDIDDDDDDGSPFDPNEQAIYTDDDELEQDPTLTTQPIDFGDEDVGLTVSEGEDLENFGSEKFQNYGNGHYSSPRMFNYMPAPSDSESSTEDAEFDQENGNVLGSPDSESDESIEQEEEKMLKDEFEGDHSASSSSSSEDDFYDYFDSPPTRPQLMEPNEDDDSYLWDYFFSSDDEDIAIKGPISHPLNPTGDSTDEDADLPPPSQRAKGRKAVEVLGTNSNMRPPVLGSWNIENTKGNVGIIDGLTTRTLSPPPEELSPHIEQEHWSSQSDDVQLDEFLNTEEMEDDDEVENDHLSTPFTYRSRFNKNVPLSAFRQRSSPYMTHPYESFRRRRRSFGKEAMISPVKALRKRPRRPRPRRPTEDLSENVMEEIFDLGAIPLFEI